MDTTPPPQRGFVRLAWGTLAFTVAVILWGAFVRITGSGAGCGSHWPRCNGEVLPELASLTTVIEFTHRVTSGVALLLVVALLVVARRRYPRGHRVRSGAAASMMLMLTEAAIGAGLVLLELVADNASLARAWWMAAHLVNTFLLVGAITLTAWWASGGAPVRVRGQGLVGALVGTALVATLLLGATGAVTALGDTLFPKSSVGLELSGTAHFLERLRVVHPALAVATGIFLVAAGQLIRRLRPDPTTRRATSALVWLFGIQLGAGTLNVVLLAPMWMQIVHLLLADAVWIALVLAAASALSAEASPVCAPAAPRLRPRVGATLP